MIELNKLSGTLFIDNNAFGRATSSNELDMLREKYTIDVVTLKSGWKTYRIPFMDGGESAVSLHLHNDILNLITIGLGKNYNFPPFEITTEEKLLIKKRLEMLGGEADYKWGKIEYSEDYKGGSVSIVIRYVL